MITESLSNLQKLRRDLAKNTKNADFLLNLGKIYFDLTFASTIDLNGDNGVRISRVADWQSHHSCINYSTLSYKLKPTIESALLMINSLSLVGDYSAIVDLILKNNLIEKFPSEKLTIMSALLHSLSRKGLLLQSVQYLYQFSPQFYNKAKKKS